MSYYHAFTPGFNWWYVATIVAVALSYLIGWAIPRVRRTAGGGIKLDMVANMRLGHLISGIFAAGWGALLINESHRGIVQFFDNSLSSQDSPAWSVILAGFAVAFLCGTMLILCVGCYAAGRDRKKRRLIRKYGLKKRTSPYAEVVRSSDATILTLPTDRIVGQ